MNEFLNKLIMYHQIHKMSRDGWSKTRISEFLGINWRTVSKYLDMSEEGFLAFIEDQSNRQKLLGLLEGFVKIKLEKYPDTSAAQMHDWLKEHYEHFPEVPPPRQELDPNNENFMTITTMNNLIIKMLLHYNERK